MAQDPNSKNGSNDKPDGKDGDVPTKPEIEQDEYLLDMVFVLDCTGSMASYINSARDNIVKISQELSKLSQKPTTNTNQPQSTKPTPDNPSTPTVPPANPSEQPQIEGQVDNAAVSPDLTDPGHPTDPPTVDSVVDPAVAPFDPSTESKESKESPTDTKENTDTTDSKSPENNNTNTNEKIINPEPKKKLSCKFAVVAYRDHPPQDHTFITQIRSFTGSSVMIKQYLSTLNAQGGGDGPESLTTALYDVLNNLNYRENSQRIIIVITDAPPHGIEGNGTMDHFPEGDPWPKWKLAKVNDMNNNNNNKRGNKLNKNKYLGVRSRCKESGESDDCPEENNGNMEDILSIVRKITDDLQASFYTVACEPCVSTNYDYARDLMEAMAEMSNGKYLPLASANLLPKVIIGSVKQQMLIDELTAQIDKEIEELKIQYKDDGKENELTEDVIAEFMEKKWENADLTYKEVAIGTLYRKERGRDNIELLLNRQECNNLKDFRNKCVKLERLKRSDFRHLSGSSSSSSSGSLRKHYSRTLCDDDEDDDADIALYYVDESMDMALDDCVERSADLSSSSKMFYKQAKKESSFSMSGVMGGIGSFFGGLTDVIKTSTTTTSVEEKEKVKSGPRAPTLYSMGRGTRGSKRKKGSKNKLARSSRLSGSSAAPTMATSSIASSSVGSSSIGDHDSMTLAMRWGDDNDDNRSCSEDEQEVYEQVRTMDKKGVKKAVSRYMQTYY